MKLLYDPEAVIVLRKHVNSRDVHIFISAHYRAYHSGLGGQAVLVEQVSGKKHIVFPAPVMYRSEEIFKEKPLRQLHILPFYGAYLFPVLPQIQLRKKIAQIISVSRLKLIKKLIRKGQKVLGIRVRVAEARHYRSSVGLIGKNAEYFLSEMLSAVFAVFFMRFLYEAFRRFPLHGIKIRIPVAGILANHIFDGKL